MTKLENQCSPQDLLDNRMNGLDTRLSTQLNEMQTQLNGLDTRLSAQLNTRQNEVNARLNRMDSRFDGIEMAIADMKGFLQERMEAMDKKVEWALTDIKPRREVTTALPETTPQQDVTAKPQVYRGCEEALRQGVTTSGIYSIAPERDNSVYSVFCEQRLDRGGWTVFQARHNGSVDFYKTWSAYKAGFGDLTNEFWLGNDKIYTLTKHHNMQLKVEITSPAGEVQYADYSRFWIDDEAHQYRIMVSGYSGGRVPGDGMAYHNGMRFSTWDADYDNNSGSCADGYRGGWWYNSCNQANLNGVYGVTSYTGLTWNQWKGGLSMKATRMMLRRRP